MNKMKGVDRILTEKLKLIEEAIKDFNKGELSSIAAMAAISCISTSSVPDEDAVQWAKDNLMKNYETGLYEEPCICRGFEGDCHNC